jgi:hypothetical protein
MEVDNRVTCDLVNLKDRSLCAIRTLAIVVVLVALYVLRKCQGEKFSLQIPLFKRYFRRCILHTESECG